jgi:UDP-N-acetylmuramate dehydrogenase
VLDAAQLAFAYRSSILKHESRPFLVLNATMQFASSDADTIKHKMDEFNAYRKRTQPSGASLGSIFKNPPNDYAGRLIEACGLKGLTIGTAQVSPVHANFFLNTGDTKAQDYRDLIERVRQQVHQQFGVWLETEIQFIGEF